MSDLLKKSIADAKAVREAALSNARSFLEEQFSSHVNELFADKLAEEIDGDEESPNPTDDSMSYDLDDSDSTTSDNIDDTDVVSDEDINEILNELDQDDVNEAEVGVEVENCNPDAAPDVAPDADDVVNYDEDGEDEEELDLNEILSELQDTESSYDDEVDDEIEDQVTDEEAVQSEDPLAEDVTIDEMADALISLDEENKRLKSSLKEHVDAVKQLKSVLSETNLLNAKLLYTNKLFKGAALTESQKIRVIDTFDLATNIREVKLAYKVLAESNNSGGSVVKSKKTNTTAQRITEGLASNPVKSTAPIIETKVDQMALRFQKLAGIVK